MIDQNLTKPAANVFRVRRPVLGFLIVALLAIFSATYASAQNAELTGTVVDPSGALIPGAEVKATNSQTNASFVTLSTEEGRYVMRLSPGTYAITAALPGFKTKTITSIVLQVGQRSKLDISLEVGEVADQVVVSGETPLLESESSTLGTVIDEQSVGKLPLNGRDFMDLALLTAGVNEGIGNGWTGVQMLAANGLRGEENNYILDGVTNREPSGNNLAERPAIDSVQEFKAETGQFSAENQSAALVVNIVTKSGTNSFHGSVYEYFRNDVLDASGFFPTSGRKKTALRRNEFGVAVGGPFQSDKHFWFFNYEGLRLKRPSVRIGLVPTPEELSGKFDIPIKDPETGENFPNNQIPADRIDPVLAAILDFYPVPNQADPAANFINQTPRTNDNDRFLVRTDHHFSNQDHLSVRVSTQDLTSFGPGVIPGMSGGNTINNTRGVAVNYNHTFSPSFLNQLTLGYNRWTFDLQAEAVGSRFAVNQGVLGIGLAPGEANETSMPNLLTLPPFERLRTGFALVQQNHNYEIRNVATWVKGSHSIKFGGGVVEGRFRSFAAGSDNYGFGTYSGQFTGHSVADALLDVPISVIKQGTTEIDYPRQTKWGVFVQDDWKVTPRLTLNAGLRYDVDLPVTNILFSSFDQGFGGLRFPQFTVDEAAARGIDIVDFFENVREDDIEIRIDEGKATYDADKNNFSPRLGFAYALGDRKTVIRGGAGIFFNSPAYLGNGGRCTTVGPPFTSRFQVSSDPLVPTISLVSTGGDALAAAQLPLRVWSFSDNRKLSNGYVQMWNLNIQRTITPSFMVEVGYVGNRAAGQTMIVDVNQAREPGPGAVDLRRPYPGFGPVMVYNSYGFSTYQGFTLRGVKRFSHGLSFLLGYTVGKALSPPLWFDGRQQDFNCFVECEKALSAFDARQRFTFSYSYTLPIGKGQAALGNRSAFLGPFVDGWELGGIVTLRSGNPFTPSVSGIVGSNTGRPVRPNRIGDGNLDQQSRERFWDPSAFVAPADFTFGTAGRNILIGPGLAFWDFSVRKDFPFGFWNEEAGLEFRAEFFNLLNRTNFGRPQTNISSPSFGQIFSTATTAREIQLALRLHW